MIQFIRRKITEAKKKMKQSGLLFYPKKYEQKLLETIATYNLKNRPELLKEVLAEIDNIYSNDRSRFN